MLIFSFTNFLSFFGGGGGTEEEEEQILKGDEVVVELEASLEDLYMGGSLKVTDLYSWQTSIAKFSPCFYHFCPVRIPDMLWRMFCLDIFPSIFFN